MKFFDKPHIERIFQVLYMLQSPTYYTTADMAKTLGTTTRTIFRYLNELRDAGIAIENMNGFQRLNLNQCTNKTMIGAIASAREWNIADNVESLETAIKKHRFVCLKNYSSSHGGTMEDRILEPFQLTQDRKFVWCYDPADSCCKVFRPSRCSKVEVLDRGWEHKSEFKSESIDIFGFHGSKQTHIVLELDTTARNLLLEDNPDAEFSLKPNDAHWILDTKVSDMRGVGRFCMGLIGHITIIKGTELKKYIAQKCSEGLNR